MSAAAFRPPAIARTTRLAPVAASPARNTFSANFGCSGFRIHGQQHHICFDYFFLPCEVHGRTSAICCRCPFYFFHLDAGCFTVLAQKLIGSQAPATGTTFFMAGGRFENYRPLRPGRRRIVADGRFGHNFNLRDAGCSLSYTGSDTVEPVSHRRSQALFCLWHSPSLSLGKVCPSRILFCCASISSAKWIPFNSRPGMLKSRAVGVPVQMQYASNPSGKWLTSISTPISN